MKYLFIAITALLILPGSYTAADNIRGTLTKIVHVSPDQPSGETVSLHLEEVLAITLDDEFDIVQCLCIEVQQTEEQRKYYDSFGLFLYGTVKPQPDPDVHSYTGTRKMIEALPPAASVLYQLSLSEECVPIQSPDTVVKKNILNREEFPLLLTVLPLMKGVPSKAAAESIRIRVFPVVADLGVLYLSLTYQENTKASAVLLNGKEISLTAAPILLPSGIHQLSVVMPEGYRKDINLVMEKGKKTQLQVYVENPLAQVFINLPSAGNFFLDGEKMDVVPAKSLNLTPGRHTVTMKIGDYSISKNFSVSSGKTYTISLIMDMDIKEKEEKK